MFDVSKIGILNISVLNLAKVLRKQSVEHGSPLSLLHAFYMAKALKEAYALGELRGRALK